MKLVIAEKPAVGRDLARVLGLGRGAKQTGLIEGRDRQGRGWVVSWCIGHLVELEEPHRYKPEWKRWRLEALPMIPERFALRPTRRGMAQWKIVRGLLRDRRFEAVVNACDAGREGELIFRYVYDLAGSRLPIERLWVSSLTDAALQGALAKLRPGQALEPLAAAARCRAEADWLVGMNLTRALTLTRRRLDRAKGASAAPGGRGELFTVGRVQTPTLAMLTTREQEIRDFSEEPYFLVDARIPPVHGAAGFAARWRGPRSPRLATRAAAEQVVSRVDVCRRDAVRGECLRVSRAERKREEEPPPLLYDLTSLQREANKRFGWPAKRSLEIAQKLYERRKLISYPRTDARHLSSDLVAQLPALLTAVGAVPDLASAVAALPGTERRLGRRFVDDAKVGDHHAIIPTEAVARAGPGLREKLDADEWRMFELIARRFVGAFCASAVFERSRVEMVVDPLPSQRRGAVGEGGRGSPPGRLGYNPAPPGPPDRFLAGGRARISPGWQQVDPPHRGRGRPPPRRGEEDALPDDGLLPPLKVGDRLPGAFAAVEKKTRPPPRYTESSLLRAMETAGRRLDDEEAREAMRECGLGTPATRAETIEGLLRHGYIERQKRSLRATPKGELLIASLEVEALRSPALTGRWEGRLQAIAEGSERAELFRKDLHRWLGEAVATTASSTVSSPDASDAGAAAIGGGRVGRCPLCGRDVHAGVSAFACTGAPACTLRIPARVAGRVISAQLAGVLLSQGRSRKLGGFRSRKGRRFKAVLCLDAQGAVCFDFGQGPTAPPEPRPRDGPPAPGTMLRHAKATVPCPTCVRGELIYGRAALGCSAWRDGCGFRLPLRFRGQTITAAELRDLACRGRTRARGWPGIEGERRKGRLHRAEGAPAQGTEPEAWVRWEPVE